MLILVSICVGFIVTFISYWWWKINRTRNLLKWIREAPRTLILGNASELRDSTEILNTFMRYCDKYNGLFSIEVVNQKYLLSANPEFLEWLLNNMDILDKSFAYKNLSSWLGNGLLIADGSIWKKGRKMLAPAFHFSILEQFIDVFNSNASILVDVLDKRVNRDSFDICPFVAMCALDIICETTMGVSINAQKNPKSDYVHSIKEKCRFLVSRTYSPLKKFYILYLFHKDFYAEIKHDRVLHRYTLSVINKRKEELKKRQKEEENDTTEASMGIKRKKALLDLLLEATVNGRPLSNDEIREQVDTFMFAGHDTTAVALSFILYCLSTHPEIQDDAFAEQKEIFKNDIQRDATYRDLQEMKFLEMVIKEGLRLYPSVPYVGRRTEKDIQYKDGNVIPKDTEILVLIYCVNRNPKYFPEPDKFNPRRFEENKSISQYGYIPFSVGPRNCIGQKYAMMELKSVLSKFLRNFEILPSGQDLKLAAQTVLTSVNGVNMKLKKRELID